MGTGLMAQPDHSVYFRRVRLKLHEYRRCLTVVGRLISSTGDLDLPQEAITIGDLLDRTEALLPAAFAAFARIREAEMQGVPPSAEDSRVAADGWRLMEALASEARRVGEATYRFPVTMADWHRVVGGKRIGATRGLPYVARGGRVTVTAPKGQIELMCEFSCSTKLADFDSAELSRMIHRVVGPGVSMIGHVAFALAFKHAAEAGEEPDGRFWFYPSEVAELLGYSREHTSWSPSGRFSKGAIQTVRRNFEQYANTRIVITGMRREVETLLYPTRKTSEAITRAPGRAGRDKKVEWKIREDLWSRVRSNYIKIPISLLHRQDAGHDEWACAIRCYEVLAYHARINARKATKGLTLSFAVLEREANVIGGTKDRRPDRLISQYAHYLDLLAKRGAISYEQTETADQKPAIKYFLAPDRLAELGGIRPKGGAVLRGSRDGNPALLGGSHDAE